MNTIENSTGAGTAREESAGNNFPETSVRERWITVVIFALTCAYLMLFRKYCDIDRDEGIILQGSQRILRGELPYRDFFSFYTPGSYYLLAGCFKLFGSSYLVARTTLVLYGGLFSAIHYLLARRVCSTASSLCVAGLVTLTCLPFRFLVLHNWDSTLWACVALYSTLRWMESGGRSWAFASGSFVSLTFLFEQSKGAGLALGIGAGLLLVASFGRRKDLLSYQPLVAASAGFIWPLALTFGYFAAHHGFTAMLSDWIWPLQHYTLANHVRYGYQNWSDDTRHLLFDGSPVVVRLVMALAVVPSLLLPSLALLPIGYLAYWVLRLHRERPLSAKCSYYVLINSALAGLLLSVVLVRADIVHFMYMAPLFYLLFAWILDGRDVPGRIFPAIRPLLIALLAFSFLAMSMALSLKATNRGFQMETQRGSVVMSAPDPVLDALQAHTAPGQTILVHPYLPLYYFLTGTFSPSRYDYLQPGMSTAEQYQEMLSRLETGRVRLVLLETSFTEKIPTSWPETPLSSIANDSLEDYILLHYHSCNILHGMHHWRFLLLLRKDLPCTK